MTMCFRCEPKLHKHETEDGLIEISICCIKCGTSRMLDTNNGSLEEIAHSLCTMWDNLVIERVLAELNSLGSDVTSSIIKNTEDEFVFTISDSSGFFVSLTGSLVQFYDCVEFLIQAYKTKLRNPWLWRIIVPIQRATKRMRDFSNRIDRYVLEFRSEGFIK